MKEECRVNYFLFGKTFFKNNRQNVFTKGAIISLKSSYSEDRKIWEFDIRLLWFWSHNFTTWLWVSNLNRSLFLFPWSGVTFHKVVLRIVQENTWKLQTQSFMYCSYSVSVLDFPWMMNSNQIFDWSPFPKNSCCNFEDKQNNCSLIPNGFSFCFTLIPTKILLSFLSYILTDLKALFILTLSRVIIHFEVRQCTIVFIGACWGKVRILSSLLKSYISCISQEEF